MMAIRACVLLFLFAENLVSLKIPLPRCELSSFSSQQTSLKGRASPGQAVLPGAPAARGNHPEPGLAQKAAATVVPSCQTEPEAVKISSVRTF